MNIAMGIPAVVVVIIAFLIVPLRDFMRVRPYCDKVLLAELFMMIITLSPFNAFLEIFFFRRCDTSGCSSPAAGVVGPRVGR